VCCRQFDIRNFLLHTEIFALDSSKNKKAVKHVVIAFRDLILFHLPISRHSQATALNALGTLSLPSDYGRREWFERLSRHYQPQSALEYYTQDSPFHRTINYILRHDPIDDICCAQPVIGDIIDCVKQLPTAKEDAVLLTLYRGQQMTIFELDKLRRCIDDIVSTKSFLSTTFKYSVASIFSGNGLINDPYMVSVIFKIHLDTGQPMRPYRLINVSAEDEVLLSPNTKFVLRSCRKLHDSVPLWLIELQAIPEIQQEQLRLIYGETFLLPRVDGERSVVVVRF
jgi:hypothetical protein